MAGYYRIIQIIRFNNLNETIIASCFLLVMLDLTKQQDNVSL